MMSSHAEEPARFDWTTVDVWVSVEGEGLIAQRDYLDDAFCAEHKGEQRGLEIEFKQVLKSVRPVLDEVPAHERPNSYEELVANDESQGRFVCNLVRGIYQTVTRKELTEVEGNEFIQVCPPVRALGLGQIMGFHGWSLRGQRGRKDPAGRNDLSMAGYLPYGDFSITQDGPQKQALSWVVSEAKYRAGCFRLTSSNLRSPVSRFERQGDGATGRCNCDQGRRRRHFSGAREVWNTA
jgi:hypothetical protein